MADTLIDAIRNAESTAKIVREDAKKQAAAYIAAEKQKASDDALAIEKKAKEEAETILASASRHAAERDAAASRTASGLAAKYRDAAERNLDAAASLILKERIGT